MSKLLNLILILAIVGVFIVAVGGGILGKAAREYAAAGGEVEARAFTVERYASATAGDNGVAVAMNESDGNQIALAYSQPTPAPAVGQAGRSDAGLIGFVGLLLFGVMGIGGFMLWMMNGVKSEKYY